MVVLNDYNEHLGGAQSDVEETKDMDVHISDRHFQGNTKFHEKDNLKLLKQVAAYNESCIKNVKACEKINNDVETIKNTDKEIVSGHVEKGDLHEAHFSSKTQIDESEQLLKENEIRSNTRGKQKTSDFRNSPENEDENVNDLETKDDDSVPIDRGWAWIILLASVFTHFIVIGQLKCFGIVFVQLQKRYGSSSSATSVIYTLMNATYSVSALIIMTIGGSLSARSSLFIGAIIASIASMITAFIDDVDIAMVTIGVASGVSNAFIMTMIATIINEYFVNKRGFANNIGNAGVSLGTIVLAPIVTKLFENYSYTGTYIIITGLNLQIFVIACLLRPMSFYRKLFSSRNTCVKGNGLDETDDVDKNPGNGTITYKIIPSNALLMRNIEKRHERNGSQILNRQISENMNSLRPPYSRRRRAISESEKGSTFEKMTGEHSSMHSLFNSTIAGFASTDVMNNSLMNLTLIEDRAKQNLRQEDKEEVQDESKTCAQKIRSTFVNSLKKLFNTKLLSKPEFLYFLACNAFLCAGCALVTAFLAPLAFENGISNDMVALMVSIISFIELGSRFVVGYISDKKWCHRSTLIAIACFILGVAAQFLHFTTTFSTIMIYAVISGLLQGVYFALFVVVILDILSFEEFKGALGFTSLVQGTASGICMPIVGYLRDSTGKYTYPYNFIGTLLIVGAVLIFFIPNVHEWSLKRQKNKADV
ncbi:monocarboxylate transporter 5-like [Mercenaria mercenaria]|uniref:monocarboxylate transporter 5-like n=1 Tax=Mercenaria mercenaria TaxID=6596 RepID=UPI00234E7A17|nr:monocarboxylate transporter 5-like [Mercenaria mercenaria]